MKLLNTKNLVSKKEFTCKDCGKKLPAGTSHKQWTWKLGYGSEEDPYNFSRVKICRDCEKYWKTRDPKPE